MVLLLCRQEWDEMREQSHRHKEQMHSYLPSQSMYFLYEYVIRPEVGTNHGVEVKEIHRNKTLS